MNIVRRLTQNKDYGELAKIITAITSVIVVLLGGGIFYQFWTRTRLTYEVQPAYVFEAFSCTQVIVWNRGTRPVTNVDITLRDLTAPLMDIHATGEVEIPPVETGGKGERKASLRIPRLVDGGKLVVSIQSSNRQRLTYGETLLVNSDQGAAKSRVAEDRLNWVLIASLATVAIVLLIAIIYLLYRFFSTNTLSHLDQG